MTGKVEDGGNFYSQDLCVIIAEVGEVLGSNESSRMWCENIFSSPKHSPAGSAEALKRSRTVTQIILWTQFFYGRVRLEPQIVGMSELGRNEPNTS